MRIVLDLQACQGHGNRVRGIGRYSRLLAQSMLRQSRDHEFVVVLNGGMPEAIEEIRADLDGLLPQHRIVLWDNPFPAAELHHQGDPWRCRVAEVMREDFLASLRPDVVHVASLFEGWNDPSAASIGRGSAGGAPTAVTLYDLIPLAMADVYLKDVPTRRAYMRKLEDLRRADLCLAISEFTRGQAMDLLGLPGDRIVNVSGSVDPVFHRLPRNPRQAATLAARYGLWRPFVMYTGGFDHRKNVAGLIRAYAGLPAELRARRQLLIVGQPPGQVHSELGAVARAAGLAADEVCFAGYVPDRDLVALYNICELYVFPSLMEGFGLPALEAMACGAPVIGADASSLPEVIGHPEAMFAANSDDAMRERMLQGLVDSGFRRQLLDHASERFQLFSWEATACATLDALESLVRATRPHRDEARPDRWHLLARQADVLSSLVPLNDLPENEKRRLAAARSENLPLPRPRQLLVDVSNLSEHDARTGIQRVVRNVLRELQRTDTRGFDVVPVRFDGAGVPRVARAFAARFAGELPPAAEDPVLDARPGDIFLGLDLSAHIVPIHYESFARLRRRGIAMYFVVYDLIPLQRPDCMDPAGVPTLHAWYRSISLLADGLCCISRAVADELVEWCDQVRPARLRPLMIGHFHLGHELESSRVADDQVHLPQLEAIKAGRCFLMVGTVEPRKGHQQALDAFELLWRDGADISLAIVGKSGWLMDEFTRRLQHHPESGRRLHWFEHIDDGGLLALYAGCAALLAASEAEGFGLPLVEAAGHGLPVIARDMPVFREVAGAHAFYFSGLDAGDLAAALRQWVELADRGLAPESLGMPRLDWKASADGLIGLVIDGQHDVAWRPSGRYRFPAADQRLRRQVGTLRRQRLFSDQRSGFLVYGPYESFVAGSYRVRALGDWVRNDGPDIWLDVVSGQGRNRLAHHEMTPGRPAAPGVLAELRLELAEDVQDLEIRLWVSAETWLAVDGFELERETGAGG